MIYVWLFNCTRIKEGRSESYTMTLIRFRQFAYYISRYFSLCIFGIYSACCFLKFLNLYFGSCHYFGKFLVVVSSNISSTHVRSFNIFVHLLHTLLLSFYTCLSLCVFFPWLSLSLLKAFFSLLPSYVFRYTMYKYIIL